MSYDRDGSWVGRACPHKNVRAGVCMGCDERVYAHTTNRGRGCEPTTLPNLRQWLAAYEVELDQVGDSESPMMSELARRIAPTVRLLASLDCDTRHAGVCEMNENEGTSGT